MGKVIKHIENVVVDSDTGEVLKKEQEIVTVLEKEPDFVKVYLTDLTYLKNLPKWTNRILYEILSFMNYENEIIVNSYLKEKISFRLGLAGKKTVDNSIAEFIKSGILIREARGVYKANPMYFGKGNWSDIKKLRLKIMYSRTGRQIEAEIDTN